MTDAQPTPQSSPDSDLRAEGAVPPVGSLVFTEIAHGANEIIIEHHGQIYRLRLTRNDKLILSK